MTDETINLAALAVNRKKPKKGEAQSILRDLVARYPEAGRELADLYTYFMPPKPKKPKTSWDWVCLAMGVQDKRPYLNYLHVCADWITATDGHRMHRVPNSTDFGAGFKLEPGFYLPNGDRVDGPDGAGIGGKYPDVERIVPRLEHCEAFTQETAPELREGDTDGNGRPRFHYYRLASGAAVNAQYWDNAVARSRYPVTFWQGPNTGADSLRVDTDEGLAVVMPMRL